MCFSPEYEQAAGEAIAKQQHIRGLWRLAYYRNRKKYQKRIREYQSRNQTAIKEQRKRYHKRYYLVNCEYIKEQVKQYRKRKRAEKDEEKLA